MDKQKPDGSYPMLPEAGPITYAMAADVESYRVPRVGNRLVGVFDVALWSTDQMRAYVDAERLLAQRTAASTAQPPSASDEQKPCATCGGSKVDPGGLPVCRDCGFAPSPAASADEWMAEAERLLGVLLVESNSDDDESVRIGYTPDTDAAYAALLAHLKARP